MFTGIIEAALPLARVERRSDSVELGLDMPEAWLGSVKLGDSIAINGCCLTVASLEGRHAGFCAIPQTLSRTNLGSVRSGTLVNLERALRAGQTLDGHLVQGHIDETAPISLIRREGDQHKLRITPSAAFLEWCVPRGSVCIDGISLTIADLTADSLSVAIIPHTWSVTNLSRRVVGEPVNLEADVIGKYVVRRLDSILGQGRRSGPEGLRLTERMLRDNGFGA